MDRHCRAGRSWAAALVIIGATLTNPASRADAQGLKFATPEQLGGIPRAAPPFAGGGLASRADLSEFMPIPGHQGTQQSCVGWAVAYAVKTYQERLETRATLVTATGQPDPARHFSPAFIYNQINQGFDGGALFPDALRLLAAQGAATMADMPYNDADFTTQPSSKARQNARKYHIEFWRLVNVQDPTEVKAQIAAGYPVMIGAVIDQSFRTAGPGFTWSSDGGQSLGGHAMVVVGYDDAKNAFKIINSWGPTWGDGGYGWIDYGHFLRVVREGYIAKDAVNDDPGVFAAGTPAAANTGPTNAAIAGASSEPPAGSKSLLPGALFEIDKAQPVAGGVLFAVDVKIPPVVSPSDTARRDHLVEVVISIYRDEGGGKKGSPVESTRKEYSNPRGGAAVKGPTIRLRGSEGFDDRVYAILPLDALNLPAARNTRLVAEAVLYIDDFGLPNGATERFKLDIP